MTCSMDRAHRRLATFTIALVLLALVPATASADTDVGASTARQSYRVKMADRYRNVFRPRIVRIARGDAVVWVNVGDVTHTASTPTWDSRAVAPGETYRRRFRRAGTFRYVCVIHPEMTGAVVVS